MNYFFILIGIILIVYIISIVIKGKFNIVESIFWILGSFAILIFSIFPKIIDSLARLLNIDYPPSLLFLLVSVFLLFINFRNTQKIAKLTDIVNYLGEEIAILKSNTSLSNRDKNVK